MIFIIVPSHLSLLAITSLALTAYTAYYFPLKQKLLPTNLDDGPLRFVPVLNGILAALVLLAAFARPKNPETIWIATIPIVMWCAVWAARGWANNVDVESLEKLKYNVNPFVSSLTN